MLREYKIRFTKRNKNGKLSKTSLEVSLVSSKDEKEILANKDGMLKYAFSKYKKKSSANHQMEDFDVTNIEIVQQINPST